MTDRARDEEGQCVEAVTPERVLAVLDDADTSVLTVSDIADDLGCTPEAVTQKRKRLQEQDRVARRQVGAHAVIGWLTEQPPRETESEHDPDESFVAAPPLDAEDGTSIDASDTGDRLGDALAEGATTPE